MTALIMRGGNPYVLLWHMACYGLAAIVEDAGAEVRMLWTNDSTPRPQVDAPGLDVATVGGLVRGHAERRDGDDSWLAQDVELRGAARGLMSPRLTPLGDDATWSMVQRRRHSVLDALTGDRQWLDLRQIAALGEPCYWSRNRQDALMQDDGASRFEMQPRNQGSEIVGSRLRKLAGTVAARAVEQIADGLRGTAVRDEAGNDKADSRTATGLTNPGPTDNAVAWCALWAISQLPLAQRISRNGRHGTAVTSGHLGRTRREWFYAPVWHQPWRPARLRSILASAQLRTAAAAGLPLDRDTVSEVDAAAARAWLAARHVVGVVRFPIERFGSDSAPERRAMRGEGLPTATGS